MTGSVAKLSSAQSSNWIYGKVPPVESSDWIYGLPDSISIQANHPARSIRRAPTYQCAKRVIVSTIIAISCKVIVSTSLVSSKVKISTPVVRVGIIIALHR